MRSKHKQGVRAFRFTKNGAIHSTPTDIANEASSALAGAPNGATFVTLKNEHGALEHVFITEDTQTQESVAFALGQAMNSRATEVDEVPDMVAAGGFANISVVRDARPMQDTQAGADFTTLSRIIGNLLMDGEWVAMSTRKPALRSESRKQAKWLDHHGMRTHQSRLPGAVVMTLYAGGRDTDRAADIATRVASGIPGFGLAVRARKITVLRDVMRWLLVALAFIAIGAGAMFLHLPLPWWAPVGGAAVSLLGALGTWKLKLPSELRTLVEELKWGFVPIAESRRTPPRKPRAEKQRTNKEGQAYTQPEFGGDYPLAPTSFLVGPHIPLALIAPHASASGGSTTASRPAPVVMRDRIGPPIGLNDKQLVYLDSSSLWSGLAVLGQAGSGKLLTLDTRIPTPDGWTTMGALRVGDKVIGRDGRPCSVTYLSDINETPDLYRITFSDGQSIDADADHQWVVSSYWDRATPRSEKSRAAIERQQSQLAFAAAVREFVPRHGADELATASELVDMLRPIPGLPWTHKDSLMAVLDFMEVPSSNAPSVQTRLMHTYSHGEALTAAIAHLEERLNVKGAAGRRSARFADGARTVAVREGRVTVRGLGREIAAAVGLHARPDIISAGRHVALAVQRSKLEPALAGVTLDSTPRRVFPVRRALLAIADRVDFLAREERSIDARERILTTAEMVAEGIKVHRKGRSNFAVRLTAPLNGPDASLPLDPRILGIWLGDGSAHDGAVTSMDVEIIDHVSSVFPIGRVETGKSGRASTYHFPGLKAAIANAGVVGVKGKLDKRIPAVYMRASFAQRLELLKGLMDTDGSVDQQGACEITLTKADLIEDVLELIRSLGIKAAVHESTAAYTLPDGSRKVTGLRHRITFTTDLQVFALERKASRLPAAGALRETQRWNYITSIEPIATRPGRCIQVDSADSTYLAAGFIPTHNTALLEHLWGCASRERVRPTGIPGTPARHAMFAFDTKGDGLASAQYMKWLAHNDDKQAAMIHVLDPTWEYGIDLFPLLPGEDSDSWARKVVAALVYIWGETSIGPESFDTLRRVLEAGLAVAHNPHIARAVTVQPVRENASPFYYADVLLTNLGDAVAVELATAIKNAGADPHDPAAGAMAYIWQRLSPLYAPERTPAQRRDLTKAPRTKIAALMSAEHWWARPKKYTWSQLLESDVAVVLNTGIGPSGMLPDDKLREDMSGLLLYTLREDIRRTCVGWFEQGRAVSIFADEVKHIANTNDRVIRALRDDDRALGVRCVFATQTPETLLPEVRRTFLGFGTVVMFRQEEAKTVGELVADLALAGDTWETADIVNLPMFHAIVRATAGGRRNEPFTVEVLNFRQQREELVWAA